MPVLEPVHIYEHDRSTSRLELVKINPTREFCVYDRGGRGYGLYTWQNGNWFDTGRNWIENPNRDVPQKFRDEIEQNPVTVSTVGPKIVWTCRHCNETMNQSEQETHLMGHLSAQLSSAGKPEVKKSDANRHGA